VDGSDLNAADALELFDGPAVLERKALEDAACDHSGLGPQLLPALGRELDHASRHIAWSQQALIVWIDDRHESRCCLRQPEQRLV